MRQRARQPYEPPQVREVTLEGRHTAQPDEFRLVDDSGGVIDLSAAEGAELADLRRAQARDVVVDVGAAVILDAACTPGNRDTALLGVAST